MSESIKQRVVEALRTIYDPEIPVNIYDIGLIYEIRIDAGGAARIVMTLTSPSCPEAESLPPEVERKVAAVDGVTSAKVEITWEPPWDPEMMSEAAKLELGMF
jgi:FeS assembly SUF system protein